MRAYNQMSYTQLLDAVYMRTGESQIDSNLIFELAKRLEKAVGLVGQGNNPQQLELPL